MGLVTGENVKAPIDLPGFDQSAMDGYAFRFSDYKESNSFYVVREIAAGENDRRKLGKGEAVRIFTGAPLPRGADTVVMQERVEFKNGILRLLDIKLQRDSNVRKQGSQIEKGKIALKKDLIISPAAVGYLAALGIPSIKCVPSPRISILVNGNELKTGTGPLRTGEIFESNSHTLLAALRSLQIFETSSIHVEDDVRILTKELKKALRTSDLIILTGGISVGNYDFTKDALKSAGVKQLFYKVRQKPGKPLYFGKKGKKIIFALPGNPAAALTCFYEYVVPAIRILAGHVSAFPEAVYAPLLHNYKKKKGLGLLLKGIRPKGGVRLLKGQESYILSSFTLADSIIYLPEDAETFKKGDLVEVHNIPGLPHS